jgi:hypothetical protein
MNHAQALQAAHLVAHIPDAARAIMDRWLDVNEEGHDPLPGLTLAGYTCRDPDAYMRAFDTNVQHSSEIAYAHGMPWTLPADEPDLVGVLRANPVAALEAVKVCKIARPWKATKGGIVRHDLRGFKMARALRPHDQAWLDEHYREEGWVLVDG